MNNDDKLKIVYDHVPEEYRLYETYDDFLKDNTNKLKKLEI
jgi:hypothetical protein